MRVLIVGGGGREHALVWKLSRSRQVDALFCAPGNGGISDLAECVAIDANDIEGLLELCRTKRIDFVVVGPENPLASGIVDVFEAKGIPIFGPGKRGALIEASKVFAKELMRKNEIPTAPFRAFSNHDEAYRYIKALRTPFVIKADGLCAGKGAYVIRDQQEGEAVLKELMVNQIYGGAGEKVIVEDFLTGVEASYLAFTDGESILPMVPSQDHKPLLDDDQGPNTGGMGAYAPIPFIDETMERKIDDRIMARTIEALRAEGISYKGVLYGGLMITADRIPYVIEFNARLGDPETQPILFKMESDLMPLLLACTECRLKEVEAIRWRKGVSVCVVLASGGYPDRPEKGKVIRGLDALSGREDVMVFHAGTKRIGNEYFTSGGRVLGVTALGSTYGEAIDKAYDAVSCIDFDGMQYRKDIGRKAVMSQ
jgi:phosphoribosylamine---glycine ligase